MKRSLENTVNANHFVSSPYQFSFETQWEGPVDHGSDHPPKRSGSHLLDHLSWLPSLSQAERLNSAGALAFTAQETLVSIRLNCQYFLDRCKIGQDFFPLKGSKHVFPNVETRVTLCNTKMCADF